VLNYVKKNLEELLLELGRSLLKLCWLHAVLNQC